jgi:hypothetical protein
LGAPTTLSGGTTLPTPSFNRIEQGSMHSELWPLNPWAGVTDLVAQKVVFGDTKSVRFVIAPHRHMLRAGKSWGWVGSRHMRGGRMGLYGVIVSPG